MDKQKIIKTIKRILVREILLPYKENELNADADLIKDYALDSIQIMELIVALEDEFGISFDEDGIELENFKSIQTLVILVERQLKSR